MINSFEHQLLLISCLFAESYKKKKKKRNPIASGNVSHCTNTDPPPPLPPKRIWGCFDVLPASVSDKLDPVNSQQDPSQHCLFFRE